jgi:RNA polymerase sigma-70 factor (ECF subfamily)
MPQEVVPEPRAVSQVLAALKETLGILEAEERFLLSAWFLDRRTLLEISRIIRVHEATVSRRMQRLTSRLRTQLLDRLQANGMSRPRRGGGIGNRSARCRHQSAEPVASFAK